MHEDTGIAADSIEPTATKANAQADYGIGLSAATPTTPPADPRTDAEVIADMRQSSAFPTLLDASPTTLEGPKRPTSPGERRAAKRAFKHDLKEARRKAKDAGREHRQATKAERQRYKSISRQLKERDRELSQSSERQRKARRAAKSVYGAVGFDRMFANGTCEVEQGLWSETVAFSDVSYQSAVEESQKATFNALAQLLDWFGSDTMIQYSVANTPIPEEEVGHRTFFNPVTAKDNAMLADQFNGILNQKMLDGCSNIRRTRHVTYACAAPDPETAERSLSRMRAQVRQQMQKCRSRTHLLDGAERLALVSDVLRPGKPFDFDYERDLSVRSPLTAKDFVCPTSLDFRPDGGDATCFKSEDTWCQVLVVRPALASEITDRAISDVLDLPVPMVFTWHLQPIDKAKSVAMIKPRQRGSRRRSSTTSAAPSARATTTPCCHPSWRTPRPRTSACSRRCCTPTSGSTTSAASPTPGARRARSWTTASCRSYAPRTPRASSSRRSPCASARDSTRSCRWRTTTWT